MSDRPSMHTELLLLCGKVRDDALTPEDARRLDALLQPSDQAKAFYVQYMSVVSLMESRGAGQRVSVDEDAAAGRIDEDVFAELLRLEQAAETEVVEQTKTLRLQGTEEKTPWQVGGALHYLAERPGVWGAIAAVLALALVLVVVFGGGEESPEPITDAPDRAGTVVATLTSEHNARWAEGAFAAGHKLDQGQRLTLTQGFAQITTNRGAVAILEAPTTIELFDNENALHLHSGKLVGLCHTPSSKGFLIRTEHADVVDLGTEFGVELAGGELATSVFNGAVRVVPKDGQAQQLTRGQTARLEIGSAAPRLVVEETVAQGFTRRLPNAGIVTAARTNIARLQPMVAPGACEEDGRLYSDRTHQINGVDAVGLPDVLLGGDMVLMPADATTYYSRDAGALALELTVAKPADVYVLISTDGRYGPWLQRDYVRTGMIVGQDFSSDKPGESQLGDGPGASIDAELEVWQRKRPITGTTIVTGESSRWMYGVIVVPAQADTN